MQFFRPYKKINNKMLKQQYINDKFEGISLGLEFKYRLTQFKGRYVLYQMNDGLIVEKIEYEKNPAIYEDHALERLYQINGINRKVSEEIRQEMELS